MDGLLELEFGEPMAVLDRGTTRPLLCRLEDPLGNMNDWVVKLPSSKRPEAAAAEIAAHRLLASFGLAGAEIGLVRLPDPSLESIFDASTEEGSALRKAIRGAEQRLCFASRFIDSVEHVDGMFRQRKPEEVLRLFFFDAFAWHADRTVRTPNILWCAGRMILIDHARAFFGVEEIDETGLTAFDYADNRSGTWSDHVALAYLRRQWQRVAVSAENCTQVVAQIQALGSAHLERLVNDWPDSLASAIFKSDLHRFVKSRFNNLPTLAQEISDALSR